MNKQSIMSQLQKKYPGKNIVLNNEEHPTEIICETDPASGHPDNSIAVAVIDQSIPHYHIKATETYKVLKGDLTVQKGDESVQLKQGDELTIEPGIIHSAIGNAAWVEVRSEPGWAVEDHIEVV
jgi:mannose-6-phosphate isomerase-like protein (cupin superfamily)